MHDVLDARGRQSGIVVVIVAVVSWMPPHAYSADTPLPPAAAGILAQMDREIIAAKTKAIVSLEKILKETTKKGDLARAVAIKEATDQLKAEIQTITTPTGTRSNTAAVVGRWRWRDFVYEFRPDFTVKHTGGVAGTWQLAGRTVEVAWENGYKYRLAITPDGLVGIQVDASGHESDFHLQREQ